MDTSTWTVDDHLEWIRNYAEQEKRMARLVIGWDLDLLGIYAGTVEAVDWPEPEDRPLRRGQVEPVRDDDTRIMHHDGFMYLVRDCE